MDSEQKPASESGEIQPAAAVAESADCEVVRRALKRLLRKRVKKFLALVPEVRADAEPKTIHDARVWSRRLQQAIAALFPKPRSGKVRRLRRIPRRVRRALGEWRNCDVLLELVAKQQRRTRSEAKRRAWEFVRNDLLQRRVKHIARAEKKLQRVDTGGYSALAQRLRVQPPEEAPEVLVGRLRESAQRAWSKWQAALSRAQETRVAEDLHRFRITTKDLRYRTELLYDVDRRQLKPQLKWLAELQDALGVWRDRQVLDLAVAAAIARAEVLLAEPQAARILLAELETDQSRQSQAVEKIFRVAKEPPEPPMESESNRALTPHVSPLT